MKRDTVYIPFDNETKSWSILYAVHPLTFITDAVIICVSAGIRRTWWVGHTSSYLHVPVHEEKESLNYNTKILMTKYPTVPNCVCFFEVHVAALLIWSSCSATLLVTGQFLTVLQVIRIWMFLYILTICPCSKYLFFTNKQTNKTLFCSYYTSLCQCNIVVCAICGDI